jgi:hypothetical protein
MTSVLFHGAFMKVFFRFNPNESADKCNNDQLPLLRYSEATNGSFKIYFSVGLTPKTKYFKTETVLDSFKLI